MKRKYYQFSLAHRISTIFILLCLVLILLFTGILYGVYYRNSSRSIQNNVKTSVKNNTDQLYSLFDRIDVSMNLVNDSSTIHAGKNTSSGDILPVTALILNYGEKEDISKNILEFIAAYRTSKEQMNSVYQSCFGQEYKYNNLFFVDAFWDNSLYMTSSSKLIGDRNGFSNISQVREEYWYQTALSKGTGGYWFVTGEQGEYLSYARPEYAVFNYSSRLVENYLGMQVVTFESRAISDYLSSYTLTDEFYIFLLDSENRIVYSNTQERTGDHFLLAEEELRDGDAHEIRYQKVKSLYNSTGLPLGLRAVTIIPLKDVERVARRNVYVILIVGIVMILMSSLFIFLSSKIVTRPMQNFIDYMKRGKVGGDTMGLELQHNEVGLLYRTYNNLMNQLEKLRRQQVETEREKRKAEVSALQAQMNPHFIYNTLNSISCVSLLSGQFEVADLITDLTEMIRYNLRSPGTMVPLSDELSIIRKYEQLEKNCYRDKLEISYDIDEGFQGFLIPKLIIQPLVENAIIHGMKSGTNVLKIFVNIFAGDGSLQIAVSDNGGSADIDMINRLCRGEETNNTRSIGVRNVYQRLKNTFGEGAQLVFSGDEEMTVARITIPFDQMNLLQQEETPEKDGE